VAMQENELVSRG